MKSKTTRIGLVLALVMAFAVAVVLLWKKEPPQIITLPNGEKYQFAGVTYGTRPVPPSLAVRVVSWLPAPLADRMRKRFAASLSQNNPGQRFPTPELIVWFRRVGTNTPSSSFYPSARLADQNGVVGDLDGMAGYPTGDAWLYAAYSVVPRRSRELESRFYQLASDRLVGKATFRNPLYGQFPQWQPESVPTVKKAEDLEVRLDIVETGYPPPQGSLISSEPLEKPLSRLGPARGFIVGQLRCTGFDISLRSSAGTNAWVLSGTELSDATGNVLGDPVDFFTQPLRTDLGGGYSKWIQGTLWPDESAWRLKLEFKRAAAITAGNQITFSNVPILKAGATGPITRTALLSSYEVVLEESVFKDGHGNDSLRWRLAIQNAPKNLTADIVRVIADTGAQLSVMKSAEARPHSVERFAILYNGPAGMTNVDVTCAIQETRTVEFFVKPPKAE